VRLSLKCFDLEWLKRQTGGPHYRDWSKRDVGSALFFLQPSRLGLGRQGKAGNETQNCLFLKGEGGRKGVYSKEPAQIYFGFIGQKIKIQDKIKFILPPAGST
jgi:hypothetical protein